MSSRELNQMRIAITNLINQKGARKGNTGADIFDALQKNNVQGYILSPDVILTEMKRPESPFQVDIAGNKIGGSELTRLSQIISADLYSQYKKKSSGLLRFKITPGKLPQEFLNTKGIAIAFDDSNRIVYYKGTTKKSGLSDNFTSFRDSIVKKVNDSIKARKDPLDPTRIYVSPDKHLLRAWNEIKAQIEAEGEAEGATSKAIEGRVGRGKKKFFEEKRTPWSGIQLGHIFGPKAAGVAGLTEDPHDIANQNLDDIKLLNVIPVPFRPRVKGIIDQIINIDTELELERRIKKNVANAKITYLIPESALNNASSGGTVGTIFKDQLVPILEALLTLKGSPSLEEMLTEYIEDLFLGKKVKSRTFKKKVKGRTKTKTSIPIVNMGSKGVKISQNRAKKGGKTSGRELIDKIINPRLHDKIKENMGKGGSKKKLNYRTGRFARSAVVEKLLPSTERNTIVAQVKYMRNPYGIFEKDGKLHKPLREPGGIFGRSIRQILQEQKIITLRRVKVELRG